MIVILIKGIWGILVLLSMGAIIYINYQTGEGLQKVNLYMDTIIKDNAKSFAENEKRFSKIEQISSHHISHGHDGTNQRLNDIDGEIKKIKNKLNIQ